MYIFLKAGAQLCLIIPEVKIIKQREGEKVEILGKIPAEQEPWEPDLAAAIQDLNWLL